jgi:AraC family transcriptional regulator
MSLHYIAALFTDHVSRGESAISQRRFAPYSYHPGAINLFPAGPIPACRPSTCTKMIVCALDTVLVEEVGSEVLPPALKGSRRQANIRDISMQRLIMLLTEEAESGGVSGKLYTDHLAHALALRFLMLSAGMHAAGAAQGTMPKRVLQRVLDRMRADLAANLDLNTLAGESGYSRSHFLRTFRAAMGCSPHQWLIRLRVEEAKLMMRDDSRSLIDIALACGFSNHAHFSNTFRKCVGIPPGGYRRNPPAPLR